MKAIILLVTMLPLITVTACAETRTGTNSLKNQAAESSNVSNDVYFSWGHDGDISLSGDEEALSNHGQYKIVYKTKLTAVLYSRGIKAGVALLINSPLGSGEPGILMPHKEINELYLNRHFFGKDDLTVQEFVTWATMRWARTNPQTVNCFDDQSKRCYTFSTNIERIQIDERGILHVEYLDKPFHGNYFTP